MHTHIRISEQGCRLVLEFHDLLTMFLRFIVLIVFKWRTFEYSDEKPTVTVTVCLTSQIVWLSTLCDVFARTSAVSLALTNQRGAKSSGVRLPKTGTSRVPQPQSNSNQPTSYL